MIQQGQNWELFGYDMRRLWRHWLSAWRECLWGYDSPVKARLDEVVKVEGEGGVEYYHAGSPVQQSETDCEAYLLPDSAVLSKTLTLPLAAEADIDAVMDFEVVANSPFPESDTGYGWKIDHRSDTSLRVQLAIVSRSSAMAYLGGRYDCHDAQAREVWAELGGSMVVLEGFGEKKRLQRYSKRLVRVAVTLACAALVIIMIFGASAGFKYLEWTGLQKMSEEVEAAALEPSIMRATLNEANETIRAVNAITREYPGPHLALAQLTQLLGDDVSLQYFTMAGREIEIRGGATNAAAVIQQLTEEPSYASVVAPQATTRQGDLERFFLNISLAGP